MSDSVHLAQTRNKKVTFIVALQIFVLRWLGNWCSSRRYLLN